jgi:hypothetical protein
LLAKDVSEMIGEKSGDLVDGFLSRHGLTRADIKGWISHRRRLLSNAEKALGLTNATPSRPGTCWAASESFRHDDSALFFRVAGKRPLNKGDIAMAALLVRIQRGISPFCSGTSDAPERHPICGVAAGSRRHAHF